MKFVVVHKRLKLKGWQGGGANGASNGSAAERVRFQTTSDLEAMGNGPQDFVGCRYGFQLLAYVV